MINEEVKTGQGFSCNPMGEIQIFTKRVYRKSSGISAEVQWKSSRVKLCNNSLEEFLNHWKGSVEEFQNLGRAGEKAWLLRTNLVLETVRVW